MRYKIPLIVFLLFLIYSCNSKQSSDKLVTEDSVSILSVQPIWEMQYDSILKTDKMVKVRDVNSDTLNSEKLIALLNNTWDQIHIDFIKTSHDTIFIKIPDSEVLTQQMGTSGSNYYMSTVIYTLTELKGIKTVNFDFIEGDHAMPGAYERFTK